MRSARHGRGRRGYTRCCGKQNTVRQYCKSHVHSVHSCSLSSEQTFCALHTSQTLVLYTFSFFLSIIIIIMFTCSLIFKKYDGENFYHLTMLSTNTVRQYLDCQAYLALLAHLTCASLTLLITPFQKEKATAKRSLKPSASPT